ncbi:DUF6893 family small protein [Streptomyces sp. NPDC059989]
MKRAFICGAAAAALAAVAIQVFPDLRRYLRMARM